MIFLQPFTSSDISKLLSWIDSEAFLKQWCGKTFDYPLDEEQLLEYIEGSKGELPVRQIYKAVLDNKHIGNITIERINRQDKNASLTCILIGEPEMRGNGYGKMLIQLATDKAFNELMLETLYLNVYAFNKPAIECYKKLGFEIFNTITSSDNPDWINYQMLLKK